MQPKKRFQDSKSRVNNKKLLHASWMKLKSEEGEKVPVKETENSDFYAKEKIENSKGSKNYYHRQAPSYGPPLPLLPHHPTAAHGHHGYQVDHTPSMFSVINFFLVIVTFICVAFTGLQSESRDIVHLANYSAPIITVNVNTSSDSSSTSSAAISSNRTTVLGYIYPNGTLENITFPVVPIFPIFGGFG